MSYLEELRTLFPRLEITRGVPEVTIISTEGHCLLIMVCVLKCSRTAWSDFFLSLQDDLANELYADAEMASMFIRISHHQRISVIIGYSIK